MSEENFTHGQIILSTVTPRTATREGPTANKSKPTERVTDVLDRLRLAQSLCDDKPGLAQLLSDCAELLSEGLR